jgi:DNA topoisomerase-1
MATLEDRDYVRIEKKRLIPEDKGRLVIAFLESFFMKYVEYDFTAGLEEKLDLISNNDLAWKDVLRDFWRDFTAAINEIKDLRVGDVLDALNDMLGPHVFPDKGDGTDPRQCPKCGTGRLSLKISGKFGAFIGCGNYPDCNYTRQLADRHGTASGDRELGFDPESGLPVVVKSGRFGPYIQLGEAENGEKPKRSSIPKGIDPASLDLDKALQLLSLPREVGVHPETGTPITAGLGRFGPFILHDGTYANLESVEDLFSIGLNRAVTVLAEKRASGGKSRFGRSVQKKVLKDLGEHPTEGGKIEVLDGKYGPYVSHNKVNATIPKGRSPGTLTVDEAIALLAERIAKGGGRKGAKKTAARPKAVKTGKVEKSAKTAKAANDDIPAARKPAAKKKAKA